MASQLELESTFVGTSKEQLDVVDSNLKAMDVTVELRPFPAINSLGGHRLRMEYAKELLVSIIIEVELIISLGKLVRSMHLLRTLGIKLCKEGQR